MLGREVCQPADLLYPLKQEDLGNDRTQDQYLAELEGAMIEARDKLKGAHKRMSREYDLRTLEKQYSKGDLVYVLNSCIPKGKSKKLSPVWKGPGMIAVKLSAFLYKVKFRTSIFTAHHDKLKKCLDRELPAWLAKYRDNVHLLELSLPQQMDVDSESVVNCHCRRLYGQEFMIQCDYCSEWFHGA